MADPTSIHVEGNGCFLPEAVYTLYGPQDYRYAINADFYYRIWYDAGTGFWYHVLCESDGTPVGQPSYSPTLLGDYTNELGLNCPPTVTEVGGGISSGGSGGALWRFLPCPNCCATTCTLCPQSILDNYYTPDSIRVRFCGRSACEGREETEYYLSLSASCTWSYSDEDGEVRQITARLRLNNIADPMPDGSDQAAVANAVITWDVWVTLDDGITYYLLPCSEAVYEDGRAAYTWADVREHYNNASAAGCSEFYVRLTFIFGDTMPDWLYMSTALIGGNGWYPI